MYQLQYLVPPSYPLVNASLDQEIMKTCAALKGVDTKGARVPNTALSIQLIIMLDGASVEIKKRGQLVYINLFCFEALHFQTVFVQVEDFYRQYNLGIPKRPKLPTWIHSIPIANTILRENEIILCQKMTVSFFWAVYAQHLKKRNPMN
ncbi:MAG TPA: hypothetical protein VNS58_09125 [Puia sp.]|nr:hypothetical protein [Puia sp.]